MNVVLIWNGLFFEEYKLKERGLPISNLELMENVYYQFYKNKEKKK